MFLNHLILFILTLIGTCYCELDILDPIKVGLVRYIKISESQSIKIVTKSLKPPIFEIDDFLNDEECQYFINKALNNGINTSELHIDEQTLNYNKLRREQSPDEMNVFSNWDSNNDGLITFDEIKSISYKHFLLYIDDEDIRAMFIDLSIKLINDEIIDYEIFNSFDFKKITDWFLNTKDFNPKYRARFSYQTWIPLNFTEPINLGIFDKVFKLTNIDKVLLRGMEPFQVVQYTKYGHYHTHFDTQSRTEQNGLECCHLSHGQSKCRLCRFITIVFYLNDVEEGGETAFPVADKNDFDYSEYLQRKNGDLLNLSKFCHNATLVVKPKKGKAILWYNHEIENGWLGKRDDYSLHGGCDVIQGTKWIANIWIPAPEFDNVHLHNIYSNEPVIKLHQDKNDEL